MSEWDDLPAPAKRGKPEMLIQQACLAYVGKCVVGGFAFAIPNETHGSGQGQRASKAYLMTRKANGVRSGSPDLYVCFHGGDLWVEVKAPKGTITESQHAVHAILRECGKHVAVVRSIEDLEGALRAAGATLRRSKLSAPIPVQPLRAAG